MEKILAKYNEKCNTPCDINEHIPTLKKYSEGCKHITEMGTREITSTWGFLAAKPDTFVGIDIYVSPNLPEAKSLSEENGINFEFYHLSTLHPGFLIDETDFLFIDTAHTYGQLKTELERHSKQVKKYIGFHDTTTYGLVNEPPYEANKDFEKQFENAPKGLVPAITEFLESNTDWELEAVWTNNNGLTIIKRKDTV